MARRRGQGHNWIWKATRLALYHRDGFACLYCGAGAEDGITLTLDHVVAMELGGGNEPANLATTCLSCNSAKGPKTPRAWFATLRRRGVDTRALSRRLRRQVAKPIDRARGRELAAMRTVFDAAQAAKGSGR